jgi:RNA polymerase sigma-70 factor (ECF subfamily)
MTDPRRFERLVTPVLPDLFRFARRLAGSDPAAEDLLHAALEKGLARLGQLADDGAFKVWQSRVLFRTFLDLRAKRTEIPMEAEALDNVIAFDRTRPDVLAGASELGDRVRGALDGLPPDQRDAVWLVDGQGLTYAETADLLGIAPGTAASRVARGRLALRTSLATVAAEQGVTR